MMISKADFEELFPDLFAHKSRSSLGERLTDTSAGSGGRTYTAPMRPDGQNARTTGADEIAPKLVPAAANWGIIPALTAMGAAWVMLAGFAHAPGN